MYVAFKFCSLQTILSFSFSSILEFVRLLTIETAAAAIAAVSAAAIPIHFLLSFPQVEHRPSVYILLSNLVVLAKLVS